MKQKAKFSIIGAFVVGGFLLASAMVVTFGAGEFFKEKDHYVLYFEDSLKGLDVGAPVRFMGVKVGNVTSIGLVFDMKNLSFTTPVHIEVESNRVKLMDYGANTEMILGSMNEDDFREELVKRGLRAQLKIDSLLTGKLYVAIGFHPNKAYTLTGKSKDVMELPTVLSDISELSRAVESIPVEAIADRFLSTVDSIDRLIASVEEDDTLGQMSEAIVAFTDLMNQARLSLEPITDSIEGAATETKSLAVNSGEGIQRTLKALEEVAVSSQSMVATAEKTMQSLDAGLGADSAVTYRLNRMLGDVSEAARALRALADYLERHPEALVFGKNKGE